VNRIAETKTGGIGTETAETIETVVATIEGTGDAPAPVDAIDDVQGIGAGEGTGTAGGVQGLHGGTETEAATDGRVYVVLY